MGIGNRLAAWKCRPSPLGFWDLGGCELRKLCSVHARGLALPGEGQPETEKAGRRPTTFGERSSERQLELRPEGCELAPHQLHTVCTQKHTRNHAIARIEFIACSVLGAAAVGL